MMAKKSSYKDELISEINSLALSQGLNTVFTTFLEITATSIAAQMDSQNARAEVSGDCVKNGARNLIVLCSYVCFASFSHT